MAVAILFFIIGTVTLTCHQVSCRPGEAVSHPNVGIYGGHQVSIKLAPFVASLRSNGSHHCGASIIHERFILTAAHCIEPNLEFKVRVGTDNINGDFGELYDIEEIIIHHDYNKRTHDNDLALIKLTGPLTFGPNVKKVMLAVTNLIIPDEAVFNVTGWGVTESHNISQKLLQVEVPKVSDEECRDVYRPVNINITPRMMCAGTRGRDACAGDSGGPLTLGDVQVGVVSFGDQCGRYAGVYTKVSYFFNWIQEKINSLQ